MQEWKDDVPFTIIPFTFRHVKASRKEYKCTTCGRVIQKGEPYLRTTWLELNGGREVRTTREHARQCWETGK